MHCCTPSLAPSKDPTMTPTLTPTHQPTPKACDSHTTNDCDPATTICVSFSNTIEVLAADPLVDDSSYGSYSASGTDPLTAVAEYVCECKEGFVMSPNDWTKCVATVAPSPEPTQSPSGTPTVAPTLPPAAPPTSYPTKGVTEPPTIAPTNSPTFKPCPDGYSPVLEFYGKARQSTPGAANTDPLLITYNSPNGCQSTQDHPSSYGTRKYRAYGRTSCRLWPESYYVKAIACR